MTAQLYFEDMSVGQELPRLTKGPLREMHLFRWSAAMENLHRIHYDRRFAMEHDKLPDLLINGSLKQQFMVQIAKDTYEDLTKESLGKVLDGFASGNPPKPGPQIDRQFSAPVGGPTTLKEPT